MSDLIDRAAAIEALEEKYFSFGIFREQRAASQCIDVIKHLPSAQPLSAWGGNPLKIECETAQPERKKGKWIDDNGILPLVCSECGYSRDRRAYHFCPNCGAEMEVEHDH